METETKPTDKKELRARELSLQKTLHCMIKSGDQNSDSFWKVRDELTEVQVKLYKPSQH
jgi:hypothetical protein